MKRLIVALGFLTRLPVPRVVVDDDDFAGAIRWYPIVGVVVGLIVAGALWVGRLADPWIGALAALAAWVAVTGALHLDGLGDVADGAGAGHADRSRMLRAMADPHIGSFGVVAIGMQIAAKLVLLHGVAATAALVLVPAIARIGPIVWARFVPPLSPNGLGAMVGRAVRGRDVLGWAAIFAGVCVALPPLASGALAIVALGCWFRWRLGGVNGDAHGAGIELVETTLLLALYLARLG